MLTDLRDAWRGLRAGRGTSVVAFLVLATAIAAGTVTFSVVDAVALRPLPFPSPDRLVSIAEQGSTALLPGPTTPPDYFAWRDRVPAFAALGALRIGASARMTIGTEPVSLTVARVTANLDEVLGVRPAMGRTFGPEHEVASGDAVVILSHDAWLRRFAGDSGILGRSVTVGQLARQVIGVLPAGFEFPIGAVRPSELWIPYVPAANDLVHDPRGGRTNAMQVVGRLKDGVSLETARAQVEQVSASLAAASPSSLPSSRVVVTSLHDRVVGPAKSWLLIVLAAVGLVMLVACANVANLLLARATVRGRELAVREALGASRLRLARVMLLEGMILSLAAAAAGIAVSFWGVALAKTVLPQGLARAASIAVDARVLMASVAAAVVCGVVFGSAPAWMASRSDLHGVMKDGTGAVVGGRGRARWLGAFLVAELAVVSVLLVATSLVVTSFVLITTADLGFDRQNVATISFSKSFAQTAPAVRPAMTSAFFGELLSTARAVPGVTDAAVLVNGVPLTGSSVRYSINIPGVGEIDGDNMLEARDVSAGYFQAMGLDVRRGRAFQDADRAGAPLVVLINDVAAQRLFPNANPVGQQITIHGTRTIVGIVESSRLRGPEQDLRPELFVPLAQSWHIGEEAYGNLVIRTASPVATTASAVRDAVRHLNGSSTVVQPVLMEESFRRLTAERRFNAGLMTLFGILAVVIGAAGIYGTMAFLVAQRVRTIGIQMALGATPARVLRAVLRHALAYVVIGVGIGVLVARATASLLSSLVFGVGVTSPSIYLMVAVALGAVGLAAAMAPALRASRIDPLVALRAE